MLEDSTLQSSLLPLVWLMAGNARGFEVANGGKVADWVVLAAMQVAACKTRDDIVWEKGARFKVRHWKGLIDMD